MSIARVQTSPIAVTSGSNAAATVAFAANVTAGNLIVVWVASYNTGVTDVVTDSLGNTYTQAGSYAAVSISRGSLWYATNITGGACTVTVTPSAGVYLTVVAAEYSGVKTASPLDGTANNTATSASTTTGTITVSAAGDLVVGLIAWNGAMLNCTTPFNCLMWQAATSAEEAVALETFSSTSLALTAAFGSSVTYAAVGASFKAVPSAPTTTHVPLRTRPL